MGISDLQPRRSPRTMVKEPLLAQRAARGDSMVSNTNIRGCADMHRAVRTSRRSFVKAGVLGSAGLSLAELLKHEARANAPTSRRPSVIILWMRGGPSHIDMWDPKPEAPVEYRGEFGVIRSNVP